MAAYILNENVSAGELQSIQEAAKGVIVKVWPGNGANVPDDIVVAILIIRKDASHIEEGRAVNIVDRGIRIVCVYVDIVEEVSYLVKMYCSAKVALGSGGLVDALTGNDSVQQDAEGNESPITKRKRHNCN